MQILRSLWLGILGLLLTLSMGAPLPSAFAAADAYPSKPVRLVIPFPPGGSNDIVGRLIGAKLTERLGKQVIVDNRGGAGGVIGSEQVEKSEPDGYTLLIVSAAYAFNPSLYKLPFDPEKSFVPVAKLGSGPNSLVVHPGVPANSVKELIALAKKEPGKLVCASAGVGSFQHLGSELFRIGSHAAGSAGPDSDVDLLVIERGPFGPDLDRRHEMTRLWRALAGFAVAKDILVYSREEVERWRGARNHVVARALREGKLLYGRL